MYSRISITYMDLFIPTYSEKSKRFTLIIFAFFLFLILLIFSLYLQAAVGLLFLSILLLIFAFFPELGLYAMIIFLPFTEWHFEFFEKFEVPFIDLLAIIVIIGFFLREIYLLLFDRENSKLYLPLFLPFILFFLSITVSNVLSLNISTNVWYSIRWILLFYFAYIVFPINVIKDKRIFKNALICFCISGLAIAVMGFISLFLQDWQDQFVRVVPTSIFGIYPIGVNHNLIAEVLIVSTFFTLAVRACFESLKTKRLLEILAIFQGLVLIGTFSRAAWIALFLQVIIYFFYIKGKSIKNVIIPISLGLIIILPLVFYMFKLQGEYNIGGTSTESRVVALEIALEKFQENPMFGYGSGEFVNLLEKNTRFIAKYGEPLDSHGVFQKVLVENGIFALFFFIAFILTLVQIFYTKLKKYKKYYKILLPIILGVFGMFVIQIFSTSYYKGKMWLPVALVLAAFNIIRINLKKYDRQEN